MRILTFIIFLQAWILSDSRVFAQAPDWAWAHNAGRYYSSSSNCIVADAAGNFYICGDFSDTAITFGSITLTNSSVSWADIFLVKYDPAGNVVWAKSFGGLSNDHVYSMAIDNNGNILLAGTFVSDTIYIDTITLYNNFSYGFDALIVKCDPNGNALWAKNAGGSSSNGDYAYRITTDAANNIIVGGYFYSNSIQFGSFTLLRIGSVGAYLARFDAAGNVLWARSIAGPGSKGVYGIVTDASGNIGMAGGFDGAYVAFNGDTLYENVAVDLSSFIFMVDTAGNVLWSDKPEASAGTFACYMGIDCDPLGRLITTGYFQNTTIFGSDTIYLGPDPSTVTVTYDSLGNIVRVRSTGTNAVDYPNAISCDSDGNIYITGIFKGPPFVFASDSLICTLWNFDDIFVLKYDSSGNELWAKSAGGTNNDIATSIVAVDGGNAAVTGHFLSQSISFNPLVLTNTGGQDVFVAYLGLSTGLDAQVKDGSKVRVYPIPSNGNLIIDFDILIMHGKLKIINALGQCVFEESINGMTKKEIQLGDLSNGIYFLKVLCENWTFTKKIILRRH